MLKEKQFLLIPKICPYCGEKTIIQQSNESKVLVCSNKNCSSKLINRLDYFASKKGLDIKGLSKATLEKLIDWGWVSSIPDIYKLAPYAKEWKTKAGFGNRSVDNILAAIEDSKTCSLDKFIAAIGIPLIGNNVAKELIKHISTYDEFRQLVDNKFRFWEWDGFAGAKTLAMWKFDYTEADETYKFLNIPDVKKDATTKTLDGLTFVITGRLTTYRNRDELKAAIEKAGGKVAGSISGNTDYLINNDINSNSSKNKSAKERGIPIVSEEDFNKLLNK